MGTRRHVGLVAVLLLPLAGAALAHGGHDHPRQEPASAYEQGMEALREGRYSLAVEHFQEATRETPDRIEAYYWLAHTHWRRGQGDEAALALMRVLDLDPSGETDWSLAALEHLAEVYGRMDELESAKDTYRRALERETRPSRIQEIETRIAEIDLALGVYEPTEGTRFNGEGEIVGIGAKRTNRYFEIASHTSDPEKEFTYYERSTRTDPGMWQAHFNAGFALVKLGRFEEAIPWFEQSDELFKADTLYNRQGLDKADAHAFLALCYLELGDTDRADHHASRATDADPDLHWSVVYTQRVRTARGDAAAAIPILEELIGKNPEEPETLHALYEAYAAVGRRDDAMTTLAEAVRVIPDDHPWRTRQKAEWEAILDRSAQE